MTEREINRGFDTVSRGFERMEKDGVAWVYAKQLAEAGAWHGFTTRHGGVSDGAESIRTLNFSDRHDSSENVRQNYQRWAKAADMDFDTMVAVNYEHGDGVEIVDASDCGRGFRDDMDVLPHCDGLITKHENVALITSHADCMPVFLMEPNVGVISGIHSGWKGTSMRIAQKSAQKMIDVFGAKPSEIIAAIGPSISQEHFEVDAPVRDSFAAEFSNVEAIRYREETNKYHIDLWKILVAQLMEAGISAKNITLAGVCTFACAEDYFSYRRDGLACGSMIGFIRKG